MVSMIPPRRSPSYEDLRRLLKEIIAHKRDVEWFFLREYHIRQTVEQGLY